MKSNPKRVFLTILPIILIFLIVLAVKIPDKKEKSIPKCIDCNIIFIDIDSLRADHLGVYGYYRNTSPNIDAFAKKSILFKNAYSQESWTKPSVQSLFSSSLPPLWRKRTKQNSILPRILKRKGYATAAFTGQISDNIVSQGFDTYLAFGGDPGMDSPNHNKTFYKAFNETFSYGLDWIRENKDRKLFLYLHGYDIHIPYHSKFEDYFDPDYNDTIDYYYIYKNYLNYYGILSTDKTQSLNFIELMNSLLKSEQIDHIIANYDGGILSLDERFDSFISELEETGILNKTIIVVFSNHGEDLFENGRFEHLFPSYSTLHVPLIIYIPRAEPKVIEAPVALVDIMPTIMNLINITTNYETLGVELISLIENPRLADASRIIPGHRYILKGEWELLIEPIIQLYNIKSDRNESNNLADKKQDVVRELLKEHDDIFIKELKKSMQK